MNPRHDPQRDHPLPERPAGDARAGQPSGQAAAQPQIALSQRLQEQLLEIGIEGQIDAPLLVPIHRGRIAKDRRIPTGLERVTQDERQIVRDMR